MLALTLKHPWPFAICFLGKRIENRTWTPWPSIVGEIIAIHGGVIPKGEDLADVLDEAHDLLQIHGMPEGWDDVTGRDVLMPGIVALARVTGHVTESSDPWFEGPIGWTLDEVLVLPKPIPCRGAQGLWVVPFDAARHIVETYSKLTGVTDR